MEDLDESLEQRVRVFQSPGEPTREEVVATHHLIARRDQIDTATVAAFVLASELVQADDLAAWYATPGVAPRKRPAHTVRFDLTPWK